MKAYVQDGTYYIHVLLSRTIRNSLPVELHVYTLYLPLDQLEGMNHRLTFKKTRAAWGKRLSAHLRMATGLMILMLRCMGYTYHETNSLDVIKRSPAPAIPPASLEPASSAMS